MYGQALRPGDVLAALLEAAVEEADLRMSTLTMVSPSSSTFMRTVPCMAGCEGPMLITMCLVWRWASSSDSWAYASVSGLAFGAVGLGVVSHGVLGVRTTPLVPGPRKMSLMGRSGISGCRSRSA